MAVDRTDTPNVPDRNPDPITGAPGSHPTGVGIGAAAGGAAGVGAAVAAGALAGSVVGPVGTAIGAIVGAVAGGYAGKAAGEAIDPTEDLSYWREEYHNRPYYKADYDYDRDLAPAYLYGSQVGRNVNDTYPDISRRDMPSSTVKTGADKGIGEKIADAGRSVKESMKDALDRDDNVSDDDRSFDRYDDDLRTNWEKVRGKSTLNYDEARSAIRDAYDRRVNWRDDLSRV